MCFTNRCLHRGEVSTNTQSLRKGLSAYQPQDMADSGYPMSVSHNCQSITNLSQQTKDGQEDEDAALVLQYLGLLSLIPEPLTLEITQEDIEKGRQTRRTAWYDVMQGGAIVEAYKRQTGDDCGEMLCHKYLSPKPGGFRLAILCDKALDLMKRFDAGETVEPTTFILEPYVVLERVPFSIHAKDGKVHVDRVSGETAKRILAGDKEALDFYVKVYVRDNVVKVTHEDKVIWERKPAGKIYNCFFSRNSSESDEIMSGTVRVDEDDNILEAWDCDGFTFMWKDYKVDILK